MASAKLSCRLASDTLSFQGTGYGKCPDKVGEKESMDIPPTKSVANWPSQCVILDTDCKELRIRD